MNSIHLDKLRPAKSLASLCDRGKILSMALLRASIFFTSFLLLACSNAAPPAVPADSTTPPVEMIAIAEPLTPAPKMLPTSAEPKLQAESALIVDAVTGRIIFQKNIDTQRAVASTQKLLTALVVSRAGPMDDPVEITKSDTLVEPSKLYIKAGEVYTRESLVKALLIKSGNDVAKALARDVAGNEAAFVQMMNATAASIGMKNSHFKNPHGLTEEGQYSTARDLAILAQVVSQVPYLRDCMKIKSYTFQYPDGRTRNINNTNQVLTRLPYCTGMKTGTTRASGRCLISSGTLHGRSAIAIALGSNLTEIWNDSEKMLRYALETR